MELSNSEKRRLKSKYGTWALITGASSGMGRELAFQLASAGLNIVVSARNVEELERLALEVREQFGVKTKIIAADAFVSEQLQTIIDETLNLDIGLIVLSAGYGTSGLFIKTSVADEVNMLRVNCEALLVLTHHFAKRFVSRHKGGIILMSSIVGFQGVPFAANYAATKAYVQSLAEALQVELSAYRVDVLAAAPGPVASGFGRRADMRMSMSLSPQQVGVPILKALGKKSTVFPGLLTKFLVTSLQTVPRWAKVRIMKAVMGGMTNHQAA